MAESVEPSTALVLKEPTQTTLTTAPEEEDDVDLPVDLAQIPALPMAKTLVLVNNFVANTTRFLNHFAHECEDRIARVSTNLTRVEILLAILEAKLNSIPDLTVAEAADSATEQAARILETTALPDTDLPAAPESTTPLPPPPPPPSGDELPDTTDSALPPPPPPPPMTPDGEISNAIVPMMNSSELVVGDAAGPEASAGFLKLKDDPLYATYFTMRRLGLPDGAISHKMKMDGLDPSVLDMDPEGPSPSAGESAMAASSAPPPPMEFDAPPPPLPPINLPPPPSSPPMSPASSSESRPPPPPSALPLSPMSDEEGAGSLFGGPPPPPSLPPPEPPLSPLSSRAPPSPPASTQAPRPPPIAPPLPPSSVSDSDFGDDESSVASTKPSNAGNAAFVKLKDDPAYAKYFQMKKMGLPDGAIRHKLLMDGVQEDILSMDPEGPSPNSGGAGGSAPAPPSSAAGPPPPMGLPTPPIPPVGGPTSPSPTAGPPPPMPPVGLPPPPIPAAQPVLPPPIAAAPPRGPALPPPPIPKFGATDSDDDDDDFSD